MQATTGVKVTDIRDANLPMDGEGKTYHLKLKEGDLASRILFVGDPERANRIQMNCFDRNTEKTEFISPRGFTTYTGKKNGVPVSIMAMGMGLAMMNFAVVESTIITKGPRAFIRLGSCGTPHPDIPIGTVVAATESILIQKNYDAFLPEAKDLKHYSISKPVKPDASLHKLMVERLQARSVVVKEAPDATADNFYASQGRIVPGFEDKNQTLIDELMQEHPETGSLQMETFELFHLANTFKEPMHTAACAIVLAQRKSGDFLSDEKKHEIEIRAGNACLEALGTYTL
jgi:uridine phosphorylase